MVRNADTGARVPGFRAQLHHCDLGVTVPQLHHLQNGASNSVQFVGL